MKGGSSYRLVIQSKLRAHHSTPRACTSNTELRDQSLPSGIHLSRCGHNRVRRCLRLSRRLRRSSSHLQETLNPVEALRALHLCKVHRDLLWNATLWGLQHLLVQKVREVDLDRVVPGRVGDWYRVIHALVLYYEPLDVAVRVRLRLENRLFFSAAKENMFVAGDDRVAGHAPVADGMEELRASAEPVKLCADKRCVFSYDPGDGCMRLLSQFPQDVLESRVSGQS